MPAYHRQHMIQDSRIQQLNDAPIGQNGRFVLYWMQASQRTRLNHALEYCIEKANELNLPPLVCFGLMDDYPEANERHYAFMLQGLEDVAKDLRRRGIGLVIRRGQPPEEALKLAKQAAMVVCDRGYLRHQKRWRDAVADRSAVVVVQVESDVVVPVEVASDKAEWAARTLRPKIHRHLPDYLKPLKPLPVKHRAARLELRSDQISLDALTLDRSVPPVERFRGGQMQARKLLQSFVRSRLNRYAADRNEPSAEVTSFMSPYLHFGHISPIEIALAASDSPEFIEELIVRRELSMNFVHFTPNYDSYDALPAWAKRTLNKHKSDKRPSVLTRAELESAKTHDRWWNAAQTEMVRTGFMHNYMRMYWGKKILEWSRTPREAYETTIYLNNRYFLDGRDPVSFANVLWIYGLHDRPWTERPIFGQIRYMNAAGLERKFDMESYEQFSSRISRKSPRRNA